MLRYGMREHNLLQILSFEHQTLRRIFVRDSRYILLDDRACIKIGRHVVAGSSDDLHTALVSLMIGLGTDKGGQERVVDVDDVMRILGNHLVGDNLHV